jgi:chromosome segregation ATPase
MLNMEDLEVVQNRWKQIEELAEKLDESHTNNAAITQLLKLLVEHLRPMNPTKEQLADATKGLTDLLNNLKQG